MAKYTMGGRPITVEEKELKIGQRAPSFELVGNEFNILTNDLFYGKVIILSCIPSIDTPICSMQTHRFHEEVAKLSKDVRVITVSKDLPFAQSRWCAANGVDNVIMASDYRNLGFASDYGVFIKEMGLLARAVFVLDKEGKIQYIQRVTEMAQEPDYAPILEAVNKLI